MYELIRFQRTNDLELHYCVKPVNFCIVIYELICALLKHAFFFNVDIIENSEFTLYIVFYVDLFFKQNYNEI